MPDLAEVISESPLAVQLIVGQVELITGDTFMMAWQGASMHNVSKLSTYVPVIGDVVHCLLVDGYGCIALGKVTGTGATVPDLPTPVVTEVSPVSAATWDQTLELWTPITLEQAPDKGAAWFYDAALFEPLTGAMLAAFEVEITRTSGGPTELFVHSSSGILTPLVLADATIYPVPATPVGAPAWVQLPLGWGEMLLNDEATGIGVGMGQYFGVYAGTGRLRITTI